MKINNLAISGGWGLNTDSLTLKPVYASLAIGFSMDRILEYWSIHAAAAAAKSPQSCPTLWDPIEGSPLGSSVPGILQARILEWVAISFSNA